jgi:membrane-associated protease RseP (regulator of RpoE activity)
MLEQTEVFHQMVAREFAVQSIFTGTGRDYFLYKFTGKLYSEDSESAYEHLRSSLTAYGLTPLFRKEGGEQVIYIVKEPPKYKIGSPVVNLVLFGLTLISVMISGVIYSYQGPVGSDLLTMIKNMLSHLTDGLPFAVSLLAILTAHEFGHYFAGRFHHTRVTLPYFIPFPFTAFGTMGAFIQMKETPRNRNHLLDIGLAGPIAGFVVAVPVLLLGLSLSKIGPIPSSFAPGQGIQIEGNSVIYLLLKYITFGKLLPAPAAMGGIAPVLYWIRYFFTGQPLPLGGVDVMLHPIAWAGWAGILVTSLNLIPAGQLDGGHIFYVLFDRVWARRLLPVIIAILAGLGFIWNGWWLWVVLILFFGRAYAEPLDQITPLDRKRKIFGVLALILFLLVFTPIPLVLVG